MIGGRSTEAAGVPQVHPGYVTLKEIVGAWTVAAEIPELEQSLASNAGSLIQ